MKTTEIKDKVNNFFLEKLEQGEIPRQRTRDTIQFSGTTGSPYKGINQLMLAYVKQEKGYKSNKRVTFGTCNKLGGAVKKGENSTFITYYQMKKGKKKNEDGSEEEVVFPLLKYFNVFNLDQTTIEEDTIHNLEIIEGESIVQNYKDRPDINPGEKPCYIPTRDVVQIPDKDNFISSETYYQTLFHELVHSTGAEKRLNRKGVANFDNFGSEQYSVEELIAEIGAMYLCTYTRIDNTVKNNSLSYIQGRIKAIKENDNILIKAGSEAWKATEYIMGV